MLDIYVDHHAPVLLLTDHQRLCDLSHFTVGCNYLGNCLQLCLVRIMQQDVDLALTQDAVLF